LEPGCEKAGEPAMFSVLSHLAALAVSAGIPHLRLLAIAIAIAALPVQPLERPTASSILTRFSSLLAPLGHQYHGHLTSEWTARAELGGDWHGTERGTARPARTTFGSVMLAVRVLPEIRHNTPLATSSADRAPPTR
jgi:hypothetical protein